MNDLFTEMFIKVLFIIMIRGKNPLSFCDKIAMNIVVFEENPHDIIQSEKTKYKTWFNYVVHCKHTQQKDWGE